MILCSDKSNNMEKAPKPVPFANIDAYMATLPDKHRNLLAALRQTIKEAAPQAEEYISYGMPAFKYYGPLVYFSAFKNHCSLFAANSSLTETMKEELKPFLKPKGTISFTAENPLPLELVKQLVRARVAENEAKANKTKTQ